MPKKKKDKPLDLSKEKEPIEMTSDELLDYALAPELAERLRKIARDEKPAERNSDKKGS
jgi:hypothetical protein